MEEGNKLVVSDSYADGVSDKIKNQLIENEEKRRNTLVVSASYGGGVFDMIKNLLIENEENRGTDVKMEREEESGRKRSRGEKEDLQRNKLRKDERGKHEIEENIFERMMRLRKDDEDGVEEEE